MQKFKQSETTATYRRIYMFLAAAADGYTAVTTLTSPTVNLFRNGVAFGSQPLTPATLTHISVGHWYYEIPQTYLSDLGILTVTVQDTSIRPVVLMAEVVNYDWTVATGATAAQVWSHADRQLTASLDPTAAQIWAAATRTLTGAVTVSGNVTVGGFTAGSITNAAFGTGAISSTTIANNAITMRLANDATASNARFTTFDSFAGYPLLSTTATHQIAVNASNHAAANVHQMQNNVITANATDASFVTEIQTGLSAPTSIQVADAVLNRNLDSTGNGTDTLNERTVRSALRAMRNKVSVASGVMTVSKEDDTTTAWTASLSNTANVTVDPT